MQWQPISWKPWRRAGGTAKAFSGSLSWVSAESWELFPSAQSAAKTSSLVIKEQTRCGLKLKRKEKEEKKIPYSKSIVLIWPVLWLPEKTPLQGTVVIWPDLVLRAYSLGKVLLPRSFVKNIIAFARTAQVWRTVTWTEPYGERGES